MQDTLGLNLDLKNAKSWPFTPKIVPELGAKYNLIVKANKD